MEMMGNADIDFGSNLEKGRYFVTHLVYEAMTFRLFAVKNTRFPGRVSWFEFGLSSCVVLLGPHPGYKSYREG